MLKSVVKVCLLGALLAVAAPAMAASEKDPWEGFNRAIFSFNQTLDDYVLLPVTRAYRAITPDPVERSVSNFFGNLEDVGSLANNLFQLKFHDAAQDTARLAANTTFGVLGLFDVASYFDLPKQGEDFGQTLGYWGVETGPYLVLPVFGPSNVRDGLGRIPDWWLDPINYVEDDEARYGWVIFRGIDKRAQLMKAEALITGDRYTFVRDAYLQRREFQVNDGNVQDIYEDDGF